MIGERGHWGPQSGGDSIDAALPAAVGQPGWLIKPEGQVFGHQGRFERAGQSPGRASRPTRPLEDRQGDQTGTISTRFSIPARSVAFRV